MSARIHRAYFARNAVDYVSIRTGYRSFDKKSYTKMSRIRYNLAVNKTTAYTRSAVSLRINLLLRAEVNFQKEVQKEIYK